MKTYSIKPQGFIIAIEPTHKKGQTMQELKMVSWNVNGIRAALGKGFMDYFNEVDADLFAIQESKLSEGQLDLDTPGYHQYWNYAEKKGYSGTAVFSKEPALSVHYGLGIDEHDHEGRICALEFEKFWFVCVYTPNAKAELKRLDYRMTWDDAYREFLVQLGQDKPVISCGDFNVAHKEIDLKNPKSNRKNPGFTDEEREKFSVLLDAGFTDTFRYFYPDMEQIYSWWSYRQRARENNTGWRIDYFICSRELDGQLVNASIRNDIYGSDHCPVELTVRF